MSHTLKLLLKIVLERCRCKIRRKSPSVSTASCQTKEREMPFSLCGCIANEAYNTNRTSTSALSITRKPLIEFVTNASSRCSRTSVWMRKTNGSSKISITSKRVPSSFQNGLTEWTEINRGVRQGCVMSPDFFNLYSEHILRRLEESNDGVTINGVCINIIRYADDRHGTHC